MPKREELIEISYIDSYQGYRRYYLANKEKTERYSYSYLSREDLKDCVIFETPMVMLPEKTILV